LLGHPIGICRLVFVVISRPFEEECVVTRFRLTRRAGAIVMAAYLTALCTVSAVAFPSSIASAHAFHAAYKSSVPAANSVVKVAPTVVSITFVQRLDPSQLNIIVYGNTDDVVSTGKAQISASDPYTASVTMKGDGSDIYRVDWNNKSAEDGDPTLGAFVFAVDSSGTSDKVQATTTTIVNTSTGVPGWLAALIGIAGLVIGAGAAMAIRPRMNR
jgi:methionine-rich copper-binding protein CopC